MSERWRCFVAIPIGEALAASLRSASVPWRSALTGADIRWREPDAWHVTLSILGDVHADRIPSIEAQLPDLVAGIHPVLLVPDGVVPWPRADEARTVSCRLRPETGIGELHNRVAGALGATERRRFRPHITLGRVRGGRRIEVADHPAALPTPELPTSVAEEVVLYRSHQDATSTTYEALARAPLGAMPA
jgi:2'-5' RNA ligase